MITRKYYLDAFPWSELDRPLLYHPVVTVVVSHPNAEEELQVSQLKEEAHPCSHMDKSLQKRDSYPRSSGRTIPCPTYDLFVLYYLLLRLLCPMHSALAMVPIPVRRLSGRLIACWRRKLYESKFLYHEPLPTYRSEGLTKL